ncbi:hypothetical protein CC79DRAFT_1387394 [Sarocladium strictum]
MSEPQKLGWVGLGAMGAPMASNLLSKSPHGSELYIYDLSEASMKLFIDRNGPNAIACTSPREVAENADIVFTMLPEGSHVRTVYLEDGTGIIAANKSPSLLVECSTIDSGTSLHVAEELKGKHPTSSFFDAPVSGGVLGAEASSLTLMLGCSEDHPSYPKLHHLLSLMGRHIVACGGPGTGLTAKICNNYCSGLIAIATAEAFNIGVKAGMDPRVLQKVFSNSTAQSAINDNWNPVPGLCPDAPASKGYKGGFKVQLMAKDFGLACGLAEKARARTVLAAAGLKTYMGASQDEKCRDLDSRVVYRYLGGREDWMEHLEAPTK